MAETFDHGERRATLMALYSAFNARDIDAALEHLAPGVDWPNAMTGGRVHGRHGVRDYWQEQWREVDPIVEPVRIDFGPGGKAHVRVDQLIRSLDGAIISHKHIGHVFEFDNSFITRMTVVDVEPEGDSGADDGNG